MQPRSHLHTKVKAMAHYQCQECGSTEFIQAHHMIPRDDSSLVVLCGDCHSKQHPHLAPSLFTSLSQQPYWLNKSAAALARSWGVHSRTIIRAAKRLGLGQGSLKPKHETLLRSAIPKLNHWARTASPKPRPQRDCPHCAYIWQGKPDATEATCPRCHIWMPLNNPYSRRSPKIRKPRQVRLIP